MVATPILEESNWQPDSKSRNRLAILFCNDRVSTTTLHTESVTPIQARQKDSVCILAALVVDSHFIPMWVMVHHDRYRASSLVQASPHTQKADPSIVCPSCLHEALQR